MSLFFTGGLAALLLLGLPVAFTLCLLAAVGLYWFNGGVLGLNQIPIIAYKSLDDFTMSALPMYVLMSQILVYSGVGKELYEMASRWLRHLPGVLPWPHCFAAEYSLPSPAPAWPRPSRSGWWRFPK